jgi:hypothetical protein
MICIASSRGPQRSGDSSVRRQWKRLKANSGIVRQIVDDGKTVNSERALHIDADRLRVLQTWRTGDTILIPDWIFASPVKLVHRTGNSLY